MSIKVGMVSLGCAKNQVDGEVLMASLEAAGFQAVDDVALADVAIVNTCGFIESAVYTAPACPRPLFWQALSLSPRA